ncbi:MAG TPA: hypothetical protein VFV78_09885 [Vicinamibacterales bacterium]|nr:hypothetical protein [Vicinamibacterales bacterium]
MSAVDRERFETNYLDSPQRRDRVETIRQLRGATHTRERAQRISIRTLALAAALVLAVIGIASVVGRERPSSLVESPPPAAIVPPAPLRIFAMTISPVSVRGTSDSSALVVPTGTDVIDLRLEGDGAGPSIAAGRVLIRTVAGQETWQGPLRPAATQPPGVIAHVEVPAARLAPDDYVITLFETGPSGSESERFRYFLRVRR